MAEKKVQAEEKKANNEKVDNKDFKVRMRIKIKAFDHKIIDQSTKTIMEVASRNDE